MSFTPEQFDRAFAEFQQFGPRRRIPIKERWKEVLPDIDPLELTALQEQCQEIEAEGVTLAEQVRDKKLLEVNAKQQLARKYPFLNQKRVDHTLSQAMYFCLK